MSVEPLKASAQVRPGHEAGFVVWVWSTHAASQDVSVKLQVAQARHVDSPHFTVCPRTGTSLCDIGTLPAGQADELQAAAFVHSAATNGEQVELTATATGTAAHSSGASGSIAVKVAPSPSPTPITTPPATTPPPASTVTLPPVSLAPGSGFGLSGAGTGTGSLGNPAGMFPTVGPDPSPSPSSSNLGFPPAKKQGTARVATAAAIVPLDSRLIGGQLAGLAVLAGAIAIAIARLSLRKPRPQDGPADQGPGK